tara:strand:- start:837 stop:2108 length:1272 start_codon:yes stop_codon:yes gene_type:complete
MANKFGFASIDQQLSSNNSSNNVLFEQIEELKQNIIYARVVDIILDDQHPNFKANGGWGGVGTIYIDNVELGSNIKSNLTASPLLPYLKNYPLVNEFVLLFRLPNKQVLQNSNITEYYYLNPISIWNNQHLNAFPNLDNSPQVQPSQNKTYQAIDQGQTRKSSDEELNYDYNSPLIGGTFVERSNIHPLLAYAGDIITEGRWGNSIRFGSTVKSKNILYNNNWSDTGENGEPITIIRNGQSEKSNETPGYLPVVEDINLDQSSIYLTSNQTIPLSTPILNNPAVNALPPQNIITYGGSQIILNSDRLVFNTKSNSIILNSKQSISIASIGPIGLYSQNNDVVLQSSRRNVRLGDSQASQSVIKGDNFLRDFEILLQKLQTLSEKLTGEPQLKVSTLAAGSLNETVSSLLNNIEGYKSKVVKTI